MGLPFTFASFLALCAPQAETPERFELEDVFQLEVALDPRFSPDGEHVVYVRRSMDIQSDRPVSRLWIVGADGEDHRPLTDGPGSASQPRWSPDGRRLLYVSSAEGSAQLYVLWMESGKAARLTQLPSSPSGLAWSPDGRSISFAMQVETPTEPMAKLPAKPEGAEWAPPAKVITSLRYRSDGAGYLKEGHDQLFVLPADGGTPLQLTSGPYDVDGEPVWTPDGRAILFSSNRREDADYEPLDSEIYSLAVDEPRTQPVPLTGRYGPDAAPRVSPDGKSIAYLGFDDEHQGYRLRDVYVMGRDGAGKRCLTAGFDRNPYDLRWSADGTWLYFLFDDHGNTNIARVTAKEASGEKQPQVLGGWIGGLSLGRPYPGGAYDLAADGRIVYTHVMPERPADLAVMAPRPSGGLAIQALTSLNEDLLGHKQLGRLEELRFQSSYDDRDLQGWVVKPPGFDPDRSYPLLLEIHGGPFANYGPRFAAEIQLFAAAGYVVFYMNPRGSTSYGEEFGNLIHHNYPGQDYDDLISGVDACIELGFVDPDRLYVTGGSGGGVLTSWIVGKTDRFRAAVVAKPVINWASFALTADSYTFFHRYWFPGYPWDHPEHYFERSPISLVGNVTTPTMLLTGEEDFRTPMSESEQYYQALKLRKVDAALVRIPGASHGIAARPSHLMSKVAHILAWFEKYGGPSD